MTHDPAGVSFWLEAAGDALTPRPALDGPVDADVAVLGAGFTGLWTAWYLLARDPSLRVVICEAHVAGYGASGRNGAWCSAAVGVTPGELARRYSPDDAARTVDALRDTVDEVGKVCAEQGLDAQFRKGGMLRIARGPHEVPSVDAARAQLDRIGRAEGCALLDREALAARVRVHRAEAAMYDPHCAVVHPGRLVRGLARLVEAAGATIYEHTPVERVLPRGGGRPGPLLLTAAGPVRADTVVLAGEAYMARLPGFARRRVLPLYSLIVLTEPLSADRWDTVGWQGHECLSSRRYTVDYLSRTVDGRILFGGRGAPYYFGSRIHPNYEQHEATHALLREQLRDWFPALGDARFTHAWGGPLGMPRDWLPTFSYDPVHGLAAAYGYTGQGVAASNLAGRVLTDLVTETPSPLLELPMVNHRPPRWEPEPLRWLATRYLQRALARIDARAEGTGLPPTGRTLAERLTRH